MTSFAVAVPTSLPPARAFEVATDWAGHSRLPFTTVDVTVPRRGVGERFIGRTRIGRFGFDDPMEVVEWEAPAGALADGHCRVVKLGRAITGEASVDVTPAGSGGSVVHWREDVIVGPRWLDRVLGPALSAGAPLVFGWVMRSQLRAAEAAAEAGARPCGEGPA